jgi:PGF-CTERM protein
MRYNKILLCTIALLCLAFQAFAQESASSTMGSSGDYLNPNAEQGASSTNPDEGLAGMVQWVDQPVTNPGPDVTKSTSTKTTATSGSEATKSTTTKTTTTPSPDEPTSTTKSTTTTSTTPGFEGAFALIGILAVAFIALRARSWGRS